MAEKNKKPQPEAMKEKELQESKKESEKESKNTAEKIGDKDELGKIKKAIYEQQEKYLRLMAEYDNFRKRSQKEKENIYPDAIADCFTDLLAVADNFERALAADCTDSDYKKGMEMTYKSLTDVFQKKNIAAFGDAGDKFDPNIHNAVMHENDESNEKQGEISEVFQKGYKMGERVLRFAMVKVIN
ncbi:MAG: nucleotide exchange factor GrpE [Oscillospiraceae bacterium]